MGDRTISWWALTQRLVRLSVGLIAGVAQIGQLLLWGSATTTISQPLANACRKCCQIVPVGPASLRIGSGWFKHAICIALCPAELVVNGLPSAIGSPHSSQHSVELLCCAVVNSAAGSGQLWVGPRRVRHSKPWILVAASVVIAKPPSQKLHVYMVLNARQCPNLENEIGDSTLDH